MGENDPIPVDPDFAGDIRRWIGSHWRIKPLHVAGMLWVAVLLLTPNANAQAVRFDTDVTTVSAQCVSGKQCPILSLPGTIVSVCGGSVSTLASCLASPATTYTDFSAGTPCPTTAQLTPQTGGACLSTADAEGNAGFWALPGQYNYFLRVPATAGGGTYGPYPINVGASAGCPLGATCDASFSTLSAACTAAGTGTLYLTRTWSGLTTQTLACKIEALANGIIKPASGQTITMTGLFNGTLTQHFDVSAGGSLASSSSFSTKAIYPQWFGATGDGTTSDSAAFQAAYDNLFALNATTLTVPRGRYLITPTTGIGITLPNGVTTQCENAQTNTSDTHEAWFLAGSDNMTIFQELKDGVHNPFGLYMYGCGFDLGSVSNSYTAVDGITTPAIAFVNVERNIFIGIPANHSGFKGGGLLYANLKQNAGGGAGRIFDIQNAYSGASTFYGVNVGTIQDNTCSGCGQGYRISGQFDFINNDYEGALNARAAFDFSETGIALTLTMSGGYVEMSDGSVTPGAAIYITGGSVSITGFYCNYTSTAGSGDACLYIGKYNGDGLFSLDVHGNKFIRADYGVYLDQLPIQPDAKGNGGATLLTGNGFISIGTKSLHIGSDITLSNYQNSGCGLLSVVGTGNMFACGLVGPLAITNTYPIDVSRCAGGVCLANVSGTVSVTNIIRGEHFSILSAGGTIVVPNADFNLTCGCDLTLANHKILNFFVDSSGIVRESDNGSQLLSGTTSYTPALEFGGASTGVTYSTQSGAYYKIGPLTYFNIKLTLTSKGSATGAASISLPSTAVGNGGGVVTSYSNMTSFQGPIASINVTGSTVRFTIPTATSSGTFATDANFSDTSVIWVSGWYY